MFSIYPHESVKSHFLVPFFSFEFIDPDHPEYARYGEIVSHFRELIQYHFRPEEKELIGID